MAVRALVLAVLVLVAVTEVANAYAIQGPAGRGRLLKSDKIDCGHACGVRCEVAGYKERCLQYCDDCCRMCNCVPSGHHSHKDECPCYRDRRNSKGKDKCP